MLLFAEYSVKLLKLLHTYINHVDMSVSCKKIYLRIHNYMSPISNCCFCLVCLILGSNISQFANVIIKVNFISHALIMLFHEEKHLSQNVNQIYYGISCVWHPFLMAGIGGPCS